MDQFKKIFFNAWKTEANDAWRNIPGKELKQPSEVNKSKVNAN